jgi:hypothetical protein
MLFPLSKREKSLSYTNSLPIKKIPYLCNFENGFSQTKIAELVGVHKSTKSLKFAAIKASQHGYCPKQAHHKALNEKR